MSKTIASMNDLISLTVMFLMIAALVAAQANATEYQAAVSAIADPVYTSYEEPAIPLKARINAQIDASALTISIDASAEIMQLLIDDK